MKRILLTLLLVLGVTGLYAQSDVVLFNTNTNNEYDAGQTLEFSLLVTNNGPTPAQNVNVTYPIPDGLVITPGIPRFEWTGSNSSLGTNISLNNTIPVLGVNETVTYTITIKIPGSFDGELPEANVTYDTQSDVEVTYQDNQETYTPGDQVIYDIAVVNNGPEVTETINVYSAIPTGITSFSWVGNGTSGTDVDLSDSLENLPIGEVVTYTITLDVPMSYTGPLVNQLSVTGTFVDATPSCAPCTDTNLSSEEGADLVVTNTNGQTIYAPGTTTVYTVTLTNNGPLTAQNVIMEFAVSPAITTLTWSGDNGSSGDLTDLIDNAGDLASGASIIYTVTADIPNDFTGNLVLSAVAESDTDDPDLSCDDCIDIDYETASADIVVVNTNNQDVYVAGTTSIYTVTVTNNGPTDAENVVVQNAIPTGITSFSWVGDNSSSGVNIPLDDTIPTLGVGETVTYTITLDIPLTYNDILVSETTVTSDTTDPDLSCDECIDTDYNTVTDADLLTTKTLNTGDTYTAGLDAIYTITVTNQGPGAAANVTIEDIVPAGLSAADAAWYGSNGSNGTGNLNDVIPVMLPNTTVTYQFTIPVPSNFDQATDIINEVTVTSDTTDPTPDCPDCTHTATPNPQANLIAVKTNGQETYVANQPTVYTITVANPGPSDAFNVVVFDPMPFNINILNWEGEGTSGEGDMLTSVPVLAAGESLEYTVTILIPENYATFVGPLQNVVTINSDTPDPEPDCPTCTDLDMPAPDFVTVDKFAYTVQELVEDILIEAECVDVSNISWQAGNLNGDFGIGYFEGNNSNFPIQSGIILRNGNVEYSQNQYDGSNMSSTASSTGDADLTQVSQDNGNTGSINDVTYLQFDFVPLTDTMTFDFLFASNEYGTFQCGFSDVFAFLLTDLTDATVTNVNLAVIPGTTTPVSVTNIRNSLYNAGCGSQNQEFFGQFNQGDAANSAINMRGQTVVMTASSPVISGNSYEIKLAIGDYNDSAFDSAVFIAAGSFDIGQPELPEDLALVTGTALCEGEEYELSVAAENPNFTYEWQYDGETILDDDGNPVTETTITITEPGTYTILASFPSDPDCQLTDEIRVEVIPEPNYSDPADLLIFSNGVDPLEFDLTENNAVILDQFTTTEALFYEVNYFDTNVGLDTGEAIPVFPSNAFPGVDGQTMYTTASNFSTDCITISSFELYVLTQPEDITLCKEAPLDGTETFDLVAENSNILSTLLSPTAYTVTYHETMAGAEDGSEFIADPSNYVTTPIDFVDNTKTLYVRVQDNNDPDAFAITPFDIIVSFKPTEVVLAPVVICELDDPDNIATFDLTAQVNEIIDASSDIDVLLTMHPTLADAEANTEPLTYPIYETDETQNQSVFFRVLEDGAPDETCITYIELELIVSPAPTPGVVTNPQICDLDNSGGELFDLTSLNTVILNGSDPATYQVTYHPTADDAENNTDEVLDPENYIAAVGTTTLHVRLTNIFEDVCYGITSFDIIVTPTPEVAALADVFACSDTGYALPVLAQGNYYTETNGGGTLLAEGTIITTTQTIYVYAESNTTPNNCTDEENFTVTIYDQPVVDTPADVFACESYTLPVLTVGNYYTGADGSGTLLNAGDEITTTQDIYIYADSGDTNTPCTDQHQYTIQIDTPPTLLPATALEECDDNFDSFTTFNLVPAGLEVTDGQPGFEISYHETFEAADFGTSPIDTPANYSAITGEIYIRVTPVGNTTNCRSIQPLTLTVYPRPTIPNVTDYVQCDVNNSPDGQETFDLTTKDSEVTLDIATISAEYYTSQANAQAGTNPITNPESYTNTESPETIWVAAVSDFGCRSVSSFDLIVNPLPVINPALDTFFSCEEIPGEGQFDTIEIDAAITQGAAGYSIRYYQTLAGAEGGGNNNLSSPFTSPTTTIYARVEDDLTSCIIITPVELEVIPAPIAPALAPLEECDFNLDNVAPFNLDPVIQNITNTLGNVSVTIHETQADANFAANAIPNTNNYTNIVDDTQTLYVRVQSTQTECFDIVPLQLIVHPVPEATTPEDYEICDNGTNDTDGIAIFDLSTRNEEILGDIDPLAFTITYYENQTAAQAGTNPITTASNYASTTTTVYARVTNNTTGCYDIVPLELIVNPLPVVNNPLPYTLCDENNPGDEQETFDLTTQYPLIVDDQNGIAITFHDTFEEAQLGDNPIPNPEAYQNQATVQTLFTRVTIEDTGCYRIVLLDIRVEPLPVLYVDNVDEELTVLCDEDGDGITFFNLDATLGDLINNGQNLEVSFHLTPEDALNNLNPITNTNNYPNITPFADVVYIRVANTLTGCTNSEAYALPLTVVPSPQVPDLEDITQCDDEDDNGQDNQALFDLTQQNQTIIDGLDPAIPDVIIHYFESEAAARNGAPRITTPANYTGTHEQTIWVRVEDPVTECFGISNFQLFLNQPLLLTTPSILTLCNSELPNDATETFDLTVKDEEILGPFGIGQGYTVTYYESEADQETGAAIPDPTQYENTDNAQTLYVTVTSTDGCESYTTLTIKVLPLPTPNQEPDALVLCDDNNSPDGEEEFNLFDAEADIRNNDPTTIITYYETEADAQNAENPIADPSAYQSATNSVWVRVAANTGNPDDQVCYQIVELPLIVNPLPVLGENGTIAPNAYCEENTDGQHTFILNEHLPFILIGEDPEDYTIRFYLDQAALDAGTALPNQYTNISTPQTILVWVENNTTGCINTAPLTLYVEEAATAFPITPGQLDTCDYDGTNDGQTTIDLTQIETQVLGGQDPLDYDVDYYENQDDAITDTNPIADPSTYINTIAGGQTIWVRVTNESTISRCYDITSIDITIEAIPEPIIQGGTLCVDYDTQEVLNPVVMDTGLDDSHTFIWYLNGEEITGATESTYIAQAVGSYSVEAISAGGCISDPIDPVTVDQSGPASEIQTSYTVSNAFSDEQTITITTTGYGEYEYQLDFGPWQTSNIFTDVSPGLHEVRIRDIGACSEHIVTLTDVSIIDYPRFFTPNADGYNDTWNIYGLSSQGGAEIYIFDRYGKLIKQISSQGEGWDGTYNGNPLPADDYWFTVTFVETQVQTFEITAADIKTKTTEEGEEIKYYVVPGTSIEIPVTQEQIDQLPIEITGQQQPVTREFKAHFSMKR
ncbi:choice-of-anchor L domain-containing protein [Flavobacterium litorale]|uniref:DUF11 domain-containing protein n=1 Tax=Flavobacterium litorale TaxID=2856519 RepID=A0ABX8VDA1_9FLAO|nr:choice-of-anchor L domain-containing protein [Flavobacterium litorale]QYJ68649.1 DUF11 domain-containing protein [Flavobacterium litorale]